MLRNNSPCVCKHSKGNHVRKQFTARDNMIDVTEGCGVRFCNCDEFRLDKLKFLEKEYDAKSGE